MQTNKIQPALKAIRSLGVFPLMIGANNQLTLEGVDDNLKKVFKVKELNHKLKITFSALTVMNTNLVNMIPLIHNILIANLGMPKSKLNLVVNIQGVKHV